MAISEEMVRRDQFLGAILRGGLPRVPFRAALPTASAEFRGRVLVIPGASGVADVFYICLKSAADSYSWKTLATG